jgi:hypothetical protein
MLSTLLLRRWVGATTALAVEQLLFGRYVFEITQYVEEAHHFLIALICAECLLILTSTEKLTIILKSPAQRSAGEKKRIAGGLVREFLGEFLIFVPVSVLLAYLVLRPMVGSVRAIPQVALDGLLGVVSYGFPYKAFKVWVVRACVRFLKEAVAVADKQVLEDSLNEEDEMEPPR